jgi:hypothetical protein
MEPETFPSFKQSGPFRQWHRSYLAGVYGSEEVSLRCLKAARYIYAEMQKEWEVDRHGNRTLHSIAERVGLDFSAQTGDTARRHEQTH